METLASMLHRRAIIHRDLTPGNVFIHVDGAHSHTKVMDFELAKTTDVDPDESIERTTQHVIIFGTPAYMSPKRLRDGDTSPQSDLRSLAMMAFELVYGSRPFEARNRRDVLVKMR
ncbi:MAG: protein kinase [Myxococcota bacterium]|nr:protein kinase [Myxococcota bacterium]